MNKVQAGRLLTLAWYLRHNVKKSQFDLSSFAAVDYYDFREEYPEAAVENHIPAKTFEEVLERYPKCRSSACALGHATSIWPKKFQLVDCVHDHLSYFDLVSVRGISLDLSGPYVCDFFGLEESEARALFSASHTHVPTSKRPK